MLLKALSVSSPPEGRGVESSRSSNRAYLKLRRLGMLSLQDLRIEKLECCTTTVVYHSKVEPWSPTNITDSFETFYRSLLRSLLYPLGKNESGQEVTPLELTSYVQQVFQVEKGMHDAWLKEEHDKPPPTTQLQVIVLEAKGIKSMDNNGFSDPFCILNLAKPSPSKKNNKESKESKESKDSKEDNNQNTLPGKSAKLANRETWLEQSSIFATTVKERTLNPLWNEEFFFDIRDQLSEELQIYMWDSDQEDATGEVLKTLESTEHKTSGIKNVFKNIKQGDKSARDFLGRVTVSLSDIPGGGYDRWFKLHRMSKMGTNVTGELRLSLRMITKESKVDETDSINSGYLQDYYQLANEVYKFVSQTKLMELKGMQWDGDLTKQASVTLDYFSNHKHVSKISLATLNLCALLECDEKFRVEDKAIQIAIAQVEMIYYSLPKGNNCSPLSDFEMSLLEKSALSFIEHSVKKLEDCPVLFPPTLTENLKTAEIKCSANVIGRLVAMKILANSKEKLCNSVAERFSQHIKMSCKQWFGDWEAPGVNVALQPQQLIELLQKLMEKIQNLTRVLFPAVNYKRFFENYQMNYSVLVSEEIDSILSKYMQDALKLLEDYQVKYQRYAVNINESSQASLGLFMNTKKLVTLIQANIPEIESLDLFNYPNWFQCALVFWLDTFRYECDTRIEKALQMDSDVMLVDSMVKFSNSSVDVLTCFTKITREWVDIGFKDPDSACVGVAVITNMICEGAKMYADRIGNSLEKNSFYTAEERFDIKDKLCMTLSNIEHVRQYLEKLPQHLNWEGTVNSVAKLHENMDAGKTTMAALRKLVSNANDDLLRKENLLESIVAEKMSKEVKKYVRGIFGKASKHEKSMDNLMHYLDSNLEVLFKRLLAPIYPRIVEALWVALLRSIVQNLEMGSKPEYYRQLLENLQTIENYFFRDLESNALNKTASPDYEYLQAQLNINAMSSQELMEEYYADMAKNITTPGIYFGHLGVKLGYVEETTQISLHVKVVNAVNLPGLDRSGFSDPYVNVELCPEPLFPEVKTKKTKTHNQNLNPSFNEIFVIASLPREVLTHKGAVLALSVMDHDTLVCDDFAGEVFVPLSYARTMRVGQSVDSCPIMMLALKRPSELKGPFQVLKSRTRWDKTAKKFINKRTKFIKNQKERTDSPTKEKSKKRDSATSFAYFPQSV